MLLCFFQEDGSFVGSARLDSQENLHALELYSARTKAMTAVSDPASLSFAALTSFSEADRRLVVRLSKGSGEQGFTGALVNRMQASGMAVVGLAGETRQRIWDRLRWARFPATTEADYALALSLWPEEDLASWKTALPA